MQLANEDIDVDGEVHRANIESHGQIREQLMDGKFNVEMMVSAGQQAARVGDSLANINA